MTLQFVLIFVLIFVVLYYYTPKGTFKETFKGTYLDFMEDINKNLVEIGTKNPCTKFKDISELAVKQSFENTIDCQSMAIQLCEARNENTTKNTNLKCYNEIFGCCKQSKK